MIRFAWVVATCALVAAAYAMGDSNGASREKRAAFERYVVNLSNWVLVRDAIEASQTESIKPLINASLELDFIRMAALYRERQIQGSEYVRCAVTKRIRSLKSQGFILQPQIFQNTGEFRKEDVDDYLSAECAGESSLNNWSSAQNPIAPSN